MVGPFLLLLLLLLLLCAAGAPFEAQVMKTIEIQTRDRITTVTLHRPEVHNAFNGEMIQELTQACEEAGASSETRVVILAAEGKTFCAGADLNWMRTVADFSYEENVAEAMA